MKSHDGKTLSVSENWREEFSEVNEPVRLILHVDADAFFASVEQALDPGLKGKAVIVGGTDRGVVSAASYEARRYGVHSAMPIVKARRLCPHGLFLRPNFGAYSAFSRKMFEIMERYSPVVEAASVDEGYVDLGGTLRLHGAPPWEVAARMLAEIRSTLDINASGGLAGTKTFAKMATGLAKPNGLIYLEPAGAVLLLGALSVGKIPGVGKRAQELLESRGIRTVSDLAAAPGKRVTSIVGAWGERLVEIARGNDTRRVRAEPRLCQKSYSKQRTLEKDLSDYQTIRSIARELAEKLSAKLRRDHKGACVITFRVRYADFKETGKSVTIKHATNSTLEIQEHLDRLIGRTISRCVPVRKVGVMLSGIENPISQDDLFDPNRHRKRERDVAVDRIRSRFGFQAVWVSGSFHQ